MERGEEELFSKPVALITPEEVIPLGEGYSGGGSILRDFSLAFAGAVLVAVAATALSIYALNSASGRARTLSEKLAAHETALVGISATDGGETAEIRAILVEAARDTRIQAGRLHYASLIVITLSSIGVIVSLLSYYFYTRRVLRRFLKLWTTLEP